MAFQSKASQWHYHQLRQNIEKMYCINDCKSSKNATK
jgi:hypothetical protein